MVPSWGMAQVQPEVELLPWAHFPKWILWPDMRSDHNTERNLHVNSFQKYVSFFSHISCKEHSNKVDGTQYHKNIPDISRTHACSLPSMGFQHGLNESKATKIHHIVNVWSENCWTLKTKRSYNLENKKQMGQYTFTISIICNDTSDSCSWNKQSVW